MITLYQFAPSFGLPVSVSPYCAKLEAYLRLTGREYETNDNANQQKSPNNAVPYVTFDGGPPVADSREIMARLEAEGPTLDEGLTEEQHELGHEIEDLVQHALYFGCLFARFVEPAGWEHQKPTVKALVPWLLSPLLVPIIRSSQVKRCKEAGFTTPTDYDQTVKAAARVEEVLGDKPYLLGDEPRTYDCAAWANLLQVAYTRSDNAGRQAVRQRKRLMDYVRRFAERIELSLPAVQ